jgi:hypoxanthine phosphoribosyltransferase
MLGDIDRSDPTPLHDQVAAHIHQQGYQPDELIAISQRLR